VHQAWSPGVDVLPWPQESSLLHRFVQAYEAFRRPHPSSMAARGRAFAARWPASSVPPPPSAPSGQPNPLRNFFEGHHEGRGIWKWTHYFDVYHRYLNRFIGQPVHVLEIGVYSGGSLDMWRDYFGPACQLYGVDIEEAVRAYEDTHVHIHVGDQTDRAFWRRTLEQIPALDVVIDDGGHRPEQQIATLESVLPRMRPGGVYICEDVLRSSNLFTDYINGLCHELNCEHLRDGDDIIAVNATPFQAAISGIHVHPFLVVIEMAREPAWVLESRRRGTEWQPFYEPDQRDRRRRAAEAVERSISR
jgi:hypothetical protein